MPAASPWGAAWGRRSRRSRARWCRRTLRAISWPSPRSGCSGEASRSGAASRCVSGRSTSGPPTSAASPPAARSAWGSPGSEASVSSWRAARSSASAAANQPGDPQTRRAPVWSGRSRGPGTSTSMEHHMRRVSQLSVLCLVAGVVTACKIDQVVPTETPPTAGIRFVNAVPDTGAVDLRAVDIVENSAFYSVAFRGTALLYYKDAQAGSRHFKIFMANTDLSLPADQQQAIASTVLKDTTVTLEAGKNYTFILWGYARGSAPAMRLSIIEDNPADPGAPIALPR